MLFCRDNSVDISRGDCTEHCKKWFSICLGIGFICKQLKQLPINCYKYFVLLKKIVYIILFFFNVLRKLMVFLCFVYSNKLYV